MMLYGWLREKDPTENWTGSRIEQKDRGQKGKRYTKVELIDMHLAFETTDYNWCTTVHLYQNLYTAFLLIMRSFRMCTKIICDRFFQKTETNWKKTTCTPRRMSTCYKRRSKYEYSSNKPTIAYLPIHSMEDNLNKWNALIPSIKCIIIGLYAPEDFCYFESIFLHTVTGIKIKNPFPFD